MAEQQGHRSEALGEDMLIPAILMDVPMPVMDGLAASSAIRALDRADAKTVPIIAMTANAFKEDVEAALGAGMNGHIAKPLDVDKMMDTLTEVLRGRAADRGRRRQQSRA